MSSNIVLSAAMTQNLLSLQTTQTQMNTTQYDLSTGYSVNSAVDNPSAYFAATSERNRATELSNLKNSMGEAVQTVTQAQNGITAITSLVQQMQAVVQSAGSATTAGRASLQTQYNTLRTQLNQAVGDANYQGTNLLANNTLTVTFNQTSTSTLSIKGFSAVAGGTVSFKAGSTITGGLGIDAAGAVAGSSWNGATSTQILNIASSQLSTALTTLQTQSQNLASNLSTVTIRQAYTSNIINTLNAGADAQTLADPNTEGANMLALQTRQQLGIEALSLSSQAQQSILHLFGL
jgi:flagellin-like hook-associated protein FlgL